MTEMPVPDEAEKRNALPFAALIHSPEAMFRSGADAPPRRIKDAEITLPKSISTSLAELAGTIHAVEQAEYQISGEL